MSTKPHLHAFTATVIFKEGEPRDIPYDGMTPLRNGFCFTCEGGDTVYISADLVAEIAMTRNPHAGVAGVA